ncbi:VWA domain-containing protein [Paenibacillus sp. SC116]|uniref:vWA domain-containing protein n=1 Tax=Paenibacillus sp. SC116 TaxID=2968986 RepID=UPI00215B5373|nr:vWA domain-containing protein [Paenibacillus sp. SC116]MCR8845022.1 VWA domain-containing protein [Paenibacillus sp. SC116]
MQRKLNLMLVLFSLIGGGVGFILGEVLLYQLSGEVPNAVLVGLYFGVLALCIGLGALIAELMSPRLNGASWRQRYAGASWKYIAPATLVLLFVVGLALQFVYGLQLGGAKKVKDIVLVIDNSGSMNRTDPNNDRNEAAKRMIAQMDADKRVAIVEFNDQAAVLQPFIQVKDQAAKDSVYAKLDAQKTTDGGTDIARALDEAMQHIKEQADSMRGTMVVLLSDGVSEMNLDAATSEYAAQHIAVNTIGLSLFEKAGSNLLQQIAERTGGQYYDVSEANQLSFVFQDIYEKIDNRTLITERTGPTADNTYYSILRVVAIVLIGAAIGLALGLMFDNRYLARSFAIGGAVAGLLAGLVLEAGLTGIIVLDSVVRLIADLVLAGIISVFTLVVPIKENYTLRDNTHRPGRSSGRGASEEFTEKPKDSRSHGF